jgi:hypothetical protein
VQSNKNPKRKVADDKETKTAHKVETETEHEHKTQTSPENKQTEGTGCPKTSKTKNSDRVNRNRVRTE